MSKAVSSPSMQSRSANRAGRPLPRRRRLDTERLHAGIAWVLRWLVFQRHRLNVAWLARECRVGDQSLRDYLNLRHPEGWHTASRLALMLGFLPEELERLTRRWMRKFRHREQRLHAGERGWCLFFPWEQPVLPAPASPPDVQQPMCQSDPG